MTNFYHADDTAGEPKGDWLLATRCLSQVTDEIIKFTKQFKLETVGSLTINGHQDIKQPKRGVAYPFRDHNFKARCEIRETK